MPRSGGYNNNSPHLALGFIPVIDPVIFQSLNRAMGKRLKWYKREGVGGCLKGLHSRLTWRDEFCPQKGVEHALDHIGDSLDSVASGIAHQLHDGGGHPYPPGHRRHRPGDPSYSGTKGIGAIWTVAGEGAVFGKEVASSQKDFAEPYRSVSRKGLVMNHFTRNLQRGVTAMKTRNIVIRCLVLLMLITSTTTIFMACASTSPKEGTGEYVDDSVITAKVKSLLANDDFVKSFKISVETYKGTVQL